MNKKPRSAWTTVSVVIVAACLLGTDARAQTEPDHDHASGAADAGTDPLALCPGCPAGRESSGTSWQPDATEVHRVGVMLGRWRLRLHGQITVLQTNEPGLRGDSGTYSVNHLMLDLRRPTGRGTLGVRSMWSLEPLMGRRGYPLLAQSGETADGVTPLVDRQHPHDLPMELAVTYARAIDADRSFSLYVAAVGAPALGPPPFMHRPSGEILPIAPITHHWFDSTHVTYGVVTAGFVSSTRIKLEASAFKGREPDQDRWGFETPRLDSYALRVSVNPIRALALQVSAGVLNDSEQLHPGADVGRITASAMYARQWSGVALDALVAWGRNNRTASLLEAPGGFYYFPGAVSNAVLAEAAVRLDARHTFVTRVERAQKDELFPLDDPRHSILYPITRATAAYLIDTWSFWGARVAPGAAVSWTGVGDDLRAEYGGTSPSWLAFLQFRTH